MLSKSMSVLCMRKSSMDNSSWNCTNKSINPLLRTSAATTQQKTNINIIPEQKGIVNFRWFRSILWCWRDSKPCLLVDDFLFCVSAVCQQVERCPWKERCFLFSGNHAMVDVYRCWQLGHYPAMLRYLTACFFGDQGWKKEWMRTSKPVRLWLEQQKCKNVHDRFIAWNHWRSHFWLTGPPFTSLSMDEASVMKCLASRSTDTDITTHHKYVRRVNNFLDAVPLFAVELMEKFGFCKLPPCCSHRVGETSVWCHREYSNVLRCWHSICKQLPICHDASDFCELILRRFSQFLSRIDCGF